jgi:hypothetical protein
VINGTNMLGKHNPRWPIGNATETIRVTDVGVPAPRVPEAPRTRLADQPAGAVGNAFRTAAATAVAWLIGLPRRAGNRLFAMNDAEAGWRGWQVTEFAGGLGRRYRDARFDYVLAPGGGVAPGGRPPGIPPRMGGLSVPPCPPDPPGPREEL